MLTARRSGPDAPPEALVPRQIELRQRLTGALLGVALIATGATAATTGAAWLWLGALAIGAVIAAHLAFVARVRRITTEAEMATAFGVDPDLDWSEFAHRLASAGPTQPGEVPATLAPARRGTTPPARTGTTPSVRSLDRQLVLFVLAWAGGVALAPLGRVLRPGSAGRPGRRRRGVLRRARAYGRRPSLGVVTLGLVATVGLTTATVVTANGINEALPALSSAVGATLDRAVPTVPGGGRPAAGAVTVGAHPAVLLAMETAGRVKGESARAAQAVKVALKQLGKPYVYAAAGPNSFDCSGLVLYAWLRTGVWLPHYSVSQYTDTARVTRAGLLPGDIVFYDTYYGPQPGHVALYIGGGMVVSANRPGTNVQVQTLGYDGTIIGYGRVR
jgi:cell wall-associated NlpC family hydrolase